ncbi:esterase-like activity of phytase family protein [Gordonia sp. CPCC 205333]|uniref:esterase-like activity of phytase family protein n=1 Tax=Gordonia sp. CPCC 205333 TaxID=3140790 RepID=UPI003AF40922
MRLSRTSTARFISCAVLTLAALTSLPTPTEAAPARCSNSIDVVGYSDALDKVAVTGQRIGGLSALTRDSTSGNYLTLPDHGPNGAVIWTLTDPGNPRIVGGPLILKDPAGRALGADPDNEGLAVGRDGVLIISSESAPSIRVFGRDGRQRSEVPVPQAFRVTPFGRAQPNTTLEGLTVTPSGDRLIAAMEGPLVGERSHRFLDYRRTASGRYALVRELVYQAGAGMRIADIAAYREDRIVVLEAAYSSGSGNTVRLTTSRIGPVSGSATARVVDRRDLANLTRCPTLGAKTKELQRNPLMDNYEGLAVTQAGDRFTLRLISDDNFSAKQVTRLLTLSAKLPS